MSELKNTRLHTNVSKCSFWVSISDSDERATMSLTDINDSVCKPKSRFHVSGWDVNSSPYNQLPKQDPRKKSRERIYLQVDSFIYIPSSHHNEKKMPTARSEQLRLLAEHIGGLSYHGFLVTLMKINLQLIEKRVVNKDFSWHSNKPGLIEWWQLSVEHSQEIEDSLCRPERKVNQLASGILHAIPKCVTSFHKGWQQRGSKLWKLFRHL